MKKLFKTDKKQVTGQKQKVDQLPVANKNEVKAFLDKVATMPKTGGDARLVFSLDATASRQATWDVATQLQTEMFLSTQGLGDLQIQLCYFRGFRDFFHSDWQMDGDSLLRIMSGIHCQAGATQIERLLRHVLKENEKKRLKCVVYIGDAMEENIDMLCQLAGELGLLNIPLFMFQERSDPLVRQAYLEMTRLSKGAYCQFDNNSVGQLRDLLKAVAVYATGGLKALQDFSKQSHQSVKLLEQQLGRAK